MGAFHSWNMYSSEKAGQRTSIGVGVGRAVAMHSQSSNIVQCSSNPYTLEGTDG
ncbi:hypothetical protein Zm00014a_028338 [Zea mays]|uniref:Uncharacterized protein n=2 Tax=Zea mays TaxID=4577 RepID=A0A8J8Y1Z8_MAIZE|nr:hypothetical protein ZEAMMB73_Zm00001d039725 [Zea mays]PWZ32359.1 hypothetical protein Zm00014a_028338 [Zea mays]